MYILHNWKEDHFVPMITSGEISDILTQYEQPWIDLSSKLYNIWSESFSQAYQMLKSFKLGISKYNKSY